MMKHLHVTDETFACGFKQYFIFLGAMVVVYHPSIVQVFWYSNGVLPTTTVVVVVDVVVVGSFCSFPPCCLIILINNNNNNNQQSTKDGPSSTKGTNNNNKKTYLDKCEMCYSKKRNWAFWFPDPLPVVVVVVVVDVVVAVLQIHNVSNKIMHDEDDSIHDEDES